MSSRHSFYSSTIGSKLLVAVTGISLVGFLIVHLIGNLLVYLGPTTFNEYSHKLIANPLVYPAEAGLVLLFILHAWKTITLTLASHKARPVASQPRQQSSPQRLPVGQQMPSAEHGPSQHPSLQHTCPLRQKTQVWSEARQRPHIPAHGPLKAFRQVLT